MRLMQAKTNHIICALLVAANFIVFLAPYWAPGFRVQIQNISPETGHAFIAPLLIEPTFPFEFPSDTIDDSEASSLSVTENGTPLGPAHSVHADIRAQGLGRYSHWGRLLYFSTSDNTDPRTNGRQYFASGNFRLSRSILIGILLADIAFIIVYRKHIASTLQRRGKFVIAAVVISLIAAAGFLAFGVFGVIDPTNSPALDWRFVGEIVTTISLACLITILQWLMGAGVARALLPKSGSSYADIMLLGFPLSLPALAILLGVALTLPFGRLVAILLWIFCVWPLFKWPLERTAVRGLLGLLPCCLICSAAFGCWMAMMWHGPTASIAGRPSVDMILFASVPWTIAAHPVFTPDLAYEGDVFPHFNECIRRLRRRCCLCIWTVFSFLLAPPQQPF